VKTILSIQSQVVGARVGNSVAAFAMERLGVRVLQAPTTLLGRRPDHGPPGGGPIPAETLAALIDGLGADGMFAAIDAVLTGYLPSRAHVRFAAEAFARVRAIQPQSLNFCDPILGDDPEGLYVDPGAAEAVREELLPIADLVSPNRFELSWLTGREVGTIAEAVHAARSLPVAVVVLATSIPVESDRIATALVEPRRAVFCTVPLWSEVPHGTGDLLTALFLGHGLNGGTDAEAVARAVAGVEATIAKSMGRDDLDLAASQDVWLRTEGATVETYESR